MWNGVSKLFFLSTRRSGPSLALSKPTTRCVSYLHSSSSTPSDNSASVIKRRSKKSNDDDASSPVNLSYIAFERNREKKECEKSAKSPLLIQHSLLGSKANWRRVAKEINYLTRRTVVSVDARNHGESPHTAGMSYTLMADDIRQLLSHLNFDQCCFMGHGMGGRIGMLLALCDPSRISKLICVDASPRNSEFGMARWATLRQACITLKTMENRLRDVSGFERKSLADKAIVKLIPDARDRSLFLMNLFIEPRQDSFESMDTRASQDQSNSLWRLNMDAFLSNPKLSTSMPDFGSTTFEKPTLFIAGENSKYLHKDHEDDVRKRFPNAQIVWIPKGGHWIQTDHHTQFMNAVLAFLEDDNDTSRDNGPQE